MEAATQQIGEPVRYGDGWKVPSSSGPGVHFVRLTPHWRCTWSAWIFGHGTPCKHLLAVKKLLVKE
jgi:hypothetical protein